MRKTNGLNARSNKETFLDVNEILRSSINARRQKSNRIQFCPEGEWSHQWVIRLSEALSVSGTLWLEFGQSWIRVLVEEFTTGSRKNKQAQTSLKITRKDYVKVKQTLNQHISRPWVGNTYLDSLPTDGFVTFQQFIKGDSTVLLWQIKLFSGFLYTAVVQVWFGTR